MLWRGTWQKVLKNKEIFWETFCQTRVKVNLTCKCNNRISNLLSIYFKIKFNSQPPTIKFSLKYQNKYIWKWKTKRIHGASAVSRRLNWRLIERSRCAVKSRIDFILKHYLLILSVRFEMYINKCGTILFFLAVDFVVEGKTHDSIDILLKTLCSLILTYLFLKAKQSILNQSSIHTYIKTYYQL